MRRTSAQILADATSAMVQDRDITDTLATLLRDCGELLSSGAVGLLVRSDRGEIELLSSTSHAKAVLELFQIQQTTGPCMDAVCGDSAISVASSANILARWPEVGPAIIEGGYQSVLASPVHWRGKPLGALVAFFADSSLRTKEQLRLAQACADVAALVVLNTAPLSAGEVSERIRSALAGRTVIEQAKGVMAFQKALDMASAYDLLVKTATRNGTSLTATAEGIVTSAQHGRGPL